MVSFRKGKTTAKTPYWLKHRTSAQVDYWVREGQVLVSEIRRRDKKGSLVGDSFYFRFDTKQAHLAEIERLKSEGAKFL